MPQANLDLDAAMAPGWPGANDTPTAIVQALNYWAVTASSTDDPYDDTHAQAAAATTMLNAYQAYLNNPAGAGVYLPS